MKKEFKLFAVFGILAGMFLFLLSLIFHGSIEYTDKSFYFFFKSHASISAHFLIVIGALIIAAFSALHPKSKRRYFLGIFGGALLMIPQLLLYTGQLIYHKIDDIDSDAAALFEIFAEYLHRSNYLITALGFFVCGLSLVLVWKESKISSRTKDSYWVSELRRLGIFSWFCLAMLNLLYFIYSLKVNNKNLRAKDYVERFEDRLETISNWPFLVATIFITIPFFIILVSKQKDETEDTCDPGHSTPGGLFSATGTASRFDWWKMLFICVAIAVIGYFTISFSAIIPEKEYRESRESLRRDYFHSYYNNNRYSNARKEKKCEKPGTPAIIGFSSGLALIILSGLAMFPVSIRRLHSLGVSGWYITTFKIAGLLPFVNRVACIGELIVFGCIERNHKENTAKSNDAADSSLTSSSDLFEDEQPCKDR